PLGGRQATRKPPHSCASTLAFNRVVAYCFLKPSSSPFSKLRILLWWRTSKVAASKLIGRAELGSIAQLQIGTTTNAAMEASEEMRLLNNTIIQLRAAIRPRGRCSANNTPKAVATPLQS